jgi:pimeloyl-ACP methyl ester carboxylesterase
MTLQTTPIRRRTAVLSGLAELLRVTSIPMACYAKSSSVHSDVRPVLTEPTPAWLTLPPTPVLPEPTRQGLANVNGVQNFYAQFGKGPHVIFLHGGLANSNYWAHQVKSLSNDFTITVMDTRGHGRSPLSSKDFSYRAFAADVVGLMRFLEITRAPIIGWSDGAITGLQLAIYDQDAVAGLFAFGANSDVNGVRKGGSKSHVFSLFLDRAAREHALLSPRPNDWPLLTSGLESMWRSQPTFTSQQLAGAKLPITIADGEHDEIIKREETVRLSHDIPGSRLLWQRYVSHFAMLQEPGQFTKAVREFLSS